MACRGAEVNARAQRLAVYCCLDEPLTAATIWVVVAKALKEKKEEVQRP